MEEMVVILKFVDDIYAVEKLLAKKEEVERSDILNILSETPLQNSEDSGFGTETLTETYIIKQWEIVLLLKNCETKTLLEICLLNICKFIERTDIPNNLDILSKSINSCLKCIRMLRSKSNCVQNIIGKFLENIFADSLQCEDNMKLDMSLEIFAKFSKYPELFEIGANILIKYIDLIISNIKLLKGDPTITFCYERDFNRANTILLTIKLLKDPKKQECIEAIIKRYPDFIKKFIDLDDYFPLGYLSYECFVANN